MNKPQKKGVIDERPRVAVRRKRMREVSAAQTQISPVYSRAIAITAEHYKTILSSCGASAFFTQDIKEMGGVKQ